MSTEGESRDSKEAEAARAEAARALDRIEVNVYKKKKVDFAALLKDTELIKEAGLMENPDVEASFHELGSVNGVWTGVRRKLETYIRALSIGKQTSGLLKKINNEQEAKRYLRLASDLGMENSRFLPSWYVEDLNRWMKKYLGREAEQPPKPKEADGEQDGVRRRWSEDDLLLPTMRPIVNPVEFIPDPLPTEPEDETGDDGIPAEKRAEVLAVVDEWRKAQRRLDELGRWDSLFIDEKSQVENRERASLRDQLEELQSRLSDTLDLAEEESYQNYLSLMREGDLLERLSVDPGQMLAHVRGDSDLFTNRVDLLREVYAQSRSDGLKKAFEKVVTILQENYGAYSLELSGANGELLIQIDTDAGLSADISSTFFYIEERNLERLLRDEGVVNIDEIVWNFRERNKDGISYYNSTIPRMMAIGDRFREYASRVGVEVVYNDQAGVIEIKKLAEEEIGRKGILLTDLERSLDLANNNSLVVARLSNYIDYYGFFAYEVAGILAGAESEEKVDLVLTELKDKIPEGKYQELVEYIKIARLKKAGKI